MPSQPTSTPLLRIEAAGAALRRRESGALETLVELGVTHAEDHEVRRGLWRATERDAPEFFAALWARAAAESRPLEVLLREASGHAIRAGDGGGTVRRVVGEVWARECCMRRSYLAAALEGVADALETTGESGGIDTETRDRLAGLSRHPDPEVAVGAARAATLLRQVTSEPTAPR